MVKKDYKDKIAFILFEGDSEDGFYKAIFEKYLKPGITRKYKVLDGGTGINYEVRR